MAQDFKRAFLRFMRLSPSVSERKTKPSSKEWPGHILLNEFFRGESYRVFAVLLNQEDSRLCDNYGSASAGSNRKWCWLHVLKLLFPIARGFNDGVKAQATP